MYSQKDLAIAMLASTATRGITTIPVPSSEHISTKPIVSFRNCIEKGGTSKEGIPGSTFPDNKKGISCWLIQL